MQQTRGRLDPDLVALFSRSYLQPRHVKRPVCMPLIELGPIFLSAALLLSCCLATTLVTRGRPAGGLPACFIQGMNRVYTCWQTLYKL